MVVSTCLAFGDINELHSVDGENVTGRINSQSVILGNCDETHIEM